MERHTEWERYDFNGSNDMYSDMYSEKTDEQIENLLNSLGKGDGGNILADKLPLEKIY